MPFCTSCGKKNEDEASFCSSCGKSIQQASPSISQQDRLSVPSSPLESAQDEAETKKKKMKDKSFIDSIYHFLFVEKDIDELRKAYLALTIADGVLNFILYYFDVYGHGRDIELKTLIGLEFFIVATLNICVVQGVNKRNQYWVLTALIITAILFILGQIPPDNESSDYEAIFNVFSNPNFHGGIVKFYTFCAMIWDTLLGYIVELLILARIMLVIHALKR